MSRKSLGLISRASRRVVVAIFISIRALRAEEQLRRQLSGSAGAGLIEDRLRVIVDGVGGDATPLRGLSRCRAPQCQLGYLWFARGEAVCLEQQPSDERGMGALDEES